MVTQLWRKDELATLVIDPLPLDSQGNSSVVDVISHLGRQTPSNGTWALFEYWMTHCLTNHQDCTTMDPLMSSESSLPTRLLDIQEEELVHLVEVPMTSSATLVAPRYAALSHCWGTTHER